MPLPTIETPKYEVKIPSTGKKVTYRPYLVKEEKILMIAMESKETEQLIKAMKDIISSCTFKKVDPDKLTLFDLEYIFLKLRSKAVGEISKLNLKCEKCEKYTTQQVNLDSIEVDMSQSKPNKIQLTDKIGIMMTWPKVDLLAKLGSKPEQDQTEAIYDVVVQCIESIYDEKKVYPASESSREELQTFIDSLNQTQFRKIQEFIEGMPKLEHKIDFECSHCKVANSIVLKGLQNFFS